MTTIQAWLAQAYNRLKGRSDTPVLDAQVLLAHSLGQSRTWLAAHPEPILEPDQLSGLEMDLGRRERGEPLPYILGRWEFYGLDLLVTPDVLIPRPETELLVDRALAWLQGLACRQRRSYWVADVGTGSGCIAIAIAAAQVSENLRLVATDISLPALHLARANAQRHRIIDQIDFLQTDLLSCIGSGKASTGHTMAGKAEGPFDLICANLPYIPRLELPGLAVTRFEPRLALDGGPDGLDLIRRLLDMAPARLASEAALLLEIEASQGQAAHSLAAAHFPHAQIEILPDLAGRDRLLFITT